MRAEVNRAVRRLVRHSVLWIKVAVLVFAGLAPALIAQKATAEQLTPRKVTITSSQSGLGGSVGTGVGYDYAFSWTVDTAVQGIIFQFCTTPLGTCTLPNAMDVSNDLVSLESQSGFPVNGTAFTEQATNLGDCSDTGTAATVTMYCLKRTETTASSGGASVTVNLDDIKNPTISSGAYLTVYIRVTLYSDASFATDVHNGVVAAGITQQLTAVGRVAERLKFCVAAIDDAAALPSDCDTSFPTTTTIDLGIIDNISVTAAPVDPSVANANTSNDKYGILMLNTNASGGTVITYFPEVASSVSGGDTDQLRAFRVVPTDCSSTVSSTTDQCFVSADPTTGSAIVAGTEEFGLTVACFNTTQGTTDNFDPANGSTWNPAYDGDGDDEDAGDCENETVDGSYIWGFDTSGVPDDIISTVTATNKVVDDEIVKIRFGASASATTPTGTYTVTTTYIATATF